MKDEEGSVILLPEMLEVWRQTLEWQPDFRQQAQFQHFYHLILQANRQLNLTRITEPQEFWEKHLWDSLSGIKPWLEENEGAQAGQRAEGREQENWKLEARGGAELQRQKDTELDDTELNDIENPPSTHLSIHSSTSYRVIDIGTGAGFPGVPVAIVCPTWQVTLLDSTRKKMVFVNQVLSELGIENVRTLVDRAEPVGQDPQHRSAYDLVLIRAVAAASVCAEYALPLLKVGGTAVLYRGQWTAAESIALEPALKQLGSKLERVEVLLTPLSQSMRHCLYLRKLQPTSALFPRAIGVPAQKPL